MHAFRFLLCFSFLLILLSCDENSNLSPYDNLSTVVDSKLFEKTSGSNFTIQSAIIKDGFLEITLAASGCNGSTWKARLIDSGLIAESYPVQRYARIEFVNGEECMAYLTKTFAFDLSLLQVPDANRVAINLTGWNNSLLYTY